MTRRGLLVAGALLVAACTAGDDPPTATPLGTVAPPSTAPGTGPPNGPSTDPPAGTSTSVPAAAVVDPDSHTALRLPSVAAFEQLAATGAAGRQTVKFSITDFLGDPTVEWLDGAFYTLHDEWYWFQLLNGHPIDGFDVDPVEGLQFDGISDVYEWADRNREALPLDLRFTSLDRLYSPGFYDAALDDPATRAIGLGSVIRLPADAGAAEPTPERWLLELEFRDGASAVQIDRYLRLLGETLPAEIADALLWVPRSREQELLAETMAAEGLPSGDRTITFDELVVPGDVEVYADGVAAGRLLLVTDDGRYSLSDAGPDDVVAVQRTPDYLPPGTALITGTPQTPLAHVNVLALNRGIPNAHLGGLVDDLELSQLGRVRAPVAVRAIGPDQLDVIALTDDEFERWKSLRSGPAISVPEVDVDGLAYIRDLGDLAALALPESEIAALRPEIGGKAAGFLGLAAPGTVAMPDDPLVVTVRAYFEHLAPLRGTIETMLAGPEFRSSARARFVLLEGRDDFERTYSGERDVAFVEDFVRDHPPGTVLGDVIAAGGLKEMVRDLDVDPATLALIEGSLAANFADFAPEQGLRFRSSSSVEDIEGFNGAGLYGSNTGFLDPTVLPDPDDHHRTVERALKRTWSSYWNIEAVEERRFENIDHLSGGMAVLVHARFDDPLEVSNGVATFTILPAGGGSVMQINVQAGATSVTNPDGEPGRTPEIVELRAIGTGGPSIVRRVASSLVDDGDVVLDDAALLGLWDQLAAVTVGWYDRINAELDADRRISTLTLDFEFREMAPEWPARRDGTAADGIRIVVKQARPLEPGLRALPVAVTELAIPRDVLARTARAVRVECPASSGGVDVFVDVFTDPLALVDMGYADDPLRVTVAGSATRIVDDTCTRHELFVSADDYLREIFEQR